MTVTTHEFTRAGSVSIWATTRAFEGIHDDFLEGCDQLFMWLLVDFDVAIDGAFATNFTADGALAPLQMLLSDLHAARSFCPAAVSGAEKVGVTHASFVVVLYDYAYDLESVGLPEGDRGSDWLKFVGTFPYEE